MKKLLLGVLSLFISIALNAQTFNTDSGPSVDTVRKNWAPGSIEVHNNIASASAGPVAIKWKVISSNFMPGWDAALTGVCDLNGCQTDIPNLQAMSGYTFGGAYTNKGDFHVVFESNNPANGTSARVTIRVMDTLSGYSRTLTFIAEKNNVGVTTTVVNEDNVKLFPNPAHDFLNVLYDAKSNVKTAAIFNLIGKTIQVYKVSDDNSAKLDLENIPSGVYFLRLMNDKGQVVATRRFTHQ